MQHALALASKARGRTSPNPMVGAVIVRDGEIVGEGYHQKAGGAHAEIHALNQAEELAEGATMYVTLEPCCHWGRTPPCTDSIIRAKLANVFVAMTDLNPRVAGNGIRQLEAAGISVQVGICEEESRQLNEVFIKYITTQCPFVILKSAISLDGKIATASGESQWITSEASRLKGHEVRAQVDAILVGVGTVIQDDPALTVRLLERQNEDPVRIVVDSRGRTPLGAKVFNPDSNAGALIAVTESAPLKKIEALKSAGADVLTIAEEGGRVCLRSLMRELGRREITSVLIEGGGEINAAGLHAGIVDKVMFFVAPKLIGGKDAPSAIEGRGIACLAEAFELSDVKTSQIGADFLIEGYLS
ncbi:bifunctional diaminohydroxyphosphoribosylaminopyrimidine deaminase/5-amino-6-(5-phosphoribosylamino)uracil reductase RibD [Candidatus Poribacteria bacterium]|nr:MAG: bifunctional diaminohydroxyphosphoribosylaminopyrimidine deaminase/5-amino-6-(5-phosphoribosylamino)uracil reductase RibD [Candidatus Poribacteria bacterium]